MSYEVQFQHEGAEYTVRGPDIDGVLRLIQGVQAIKKPADDGWVEWSGEGCPVPSGVVVVVQLRSEIQMRGEGQAFKWQHYDLLTDIVRYRVCE